MSETQIVVEGFIVKSVYQAKQENVKDSDGVPEKMSPLGGPTLKKLFEYWAFWFLFIRPYGFGLPTLPPFCQL